MMRCQTQRGLVEPNGLMMNQKMQDHVYECGAKDQNAGSV